MTGKTIMALCLLCISFVTVYADSFVVKYNNEVLTGANNVIDITEAEKYMGDDVMKIHFELEVTKAPKSIFVDWDLKGALPGTTNDLCWDKCFTPADESDTFYEVPYEQPGNDAPYVTYYPNGVIGTSTMIYQFSSDNEAETPVIITVNFKYNGNETGISSDRHAQDFFVFQASGSNHFDIRSDKKMSGVCIYDLSGNQVEILSGTETGRELQKGCYLLVLTDEQGTSVTRKGIIR